MGVSVFLVKTFLLVSKGNKKKKQRHFYGVP